MSAWENKMTVGDLHRRYEAGEIDVDEVGEKVAERLCKVADNLKVPDGVDRAYYVDELKRFAEMFKHEVCGDEGNYDYILDDLYDLADATVGGEGFFDARKLLWIEGAHE